MKWRLRNIYKMSFLQIFLRILTILSVFQFDSFIVTVNCLPNGVPGLAAVIPPPQVLLPPHREESQPLDEIYLLGTGPKRTVPSLNRAANINVVQTFRPPPPAPPSRSSNKTPSSAEEITIPQAPKHRTPQRKQYTKADLIAAANSLRPAGFDFNKVLFVTPQRLAAATNSAFPAGGINNGSKLVSVTDTSDASLVPLYEHVMFPLPLFDTPVFNELKPLMEMLMKEAGTKFAKFGAPGDSNKKVLVILPKSMLTSSGSGSLVNRNQQPIKQTRTPPTKAQLQTHSRPQPFQKSSTPSQIKREQGGPKFIIVPKGTKLATSLTTSKPKPAPPSSVTTTKRVLKSVKSSNTPVKKPEKGSDLQVAATSNKFSHRSGTTTGGNLPSGGGASSSVDSEKRSYSISKGGDKYSFSYAVKNDEFKDVKSHSESRDGNMVAGEYSMLEPDGYTRVVKYTVDSDQGFKASVKRIPPS